MYDEVPALTGFLTDLPDQAGPTCGELVTTGA